jgi:flavin-binding protein dodecin
MAVANAVTITAASSESFDAAVRKGLAPASRTLRDITGLHVIEHKASVENGRSTITVRRRSDLHSRKLNRARPVTRATG